MSTIDGSLGNNTKSIQVVERCFAIMEEIALCGGEAPLSHLSKSIGLPHSTIHRFLSTLLKLGYIEQNADNGRYRMGLKILMLSGTILANLDLRRVSRIYLTKLMEMTRETSNLTVLDNDEVVYIEKVESKATVRAFSLIGKRAPVHSTGAGKVLLSEMALHDVIAILKRRGMPVLTEKTVTDVRSYLSGLHGVRRDGFALDDEECEVGVRCIAAPVRDHSCKVIAAISISGPTTRITDERLPLLSRSVIDVAYEISQDMGFRQEMLEVT